MKEHRETSWYAVARLRRRVKERRKKGERNLEEDMAWINLVLSEMGKFPAHCCVFIDGKSQGSEASSNQGDLFFKIYLKLSRFFLICLITLNPFFLSVHIWLVFSHSTISTRI